MSTIVRLIASIVSAAAAKMGVTADLAALITTDLAAPITTELVAPILALVQALIRLHGRRASWNAVQWYSHWECLICDGNVGACDITSSMNDRSWARASSIFGGKSRSCSVSGNLTKCC